ncbi:Adenylate cyclase type 10 [Chelonia mydas]|uniref:Adenylate cyclase type 10 n=1 Tax=Chelonia mydas TaxID=8469 RepID=M7BK29_CHEMY|nr:Adenylate cyclase type 10 [Chelonia mydas]
MGKKEVEVSFPPRQVQVVALLPDLLVYNNPSLRRMLPSMETFNGVLLCVKITGDALLVLWKVERSQLSDIITLAAKCSLEMQEQFGFSYTEVGPELQLKIGLSAGHVSQLIVGDEMRQYWLVTGQQVDDVRLAQSLAQAREVILSPNCWELCDRDVLEAEMLTGQKARKLQYLKIFHPPDFDEHFEKCIDHLQHYPNDEVLLRNAVALASSHGLELALRRFVLGNVLKKIDDNQPLEFVSELRLVTAVSVKLQFHESTKMTELCKLVQDATVSISGIMEGWRGKIIKISTFGKFPVSAEVSHMDNETKQKEEEMLFLRVLRKAAEEATLVFIIDEAQYIDATSWDFLAKLLLGVPIFIVLSLSPFASKELLPCASAEGIMKSPKTTGIVLRELEPSKLLEMARQALGVVSIPREMETFLIQRSFGVPLYCEALLTDLHANGVLEFCRIPEEEKEEDEWDNLSISAVKSIPYRAPLVSSKENKELYVCTIRTGVDLDTVLLPARLQEIAVAQLDSLSPSEQMAVKCAAVIGHTFTPELLLYILPEWTNKKMEETLMSLIISHVFEYVGKETRATQAVGSCHLHTHLGPQTVQSLGPEDSEDVGAAAPSFSLQEELGMLQRDQAMRFCTPLLREGAYELWLGDQKKALHLKCAAFLEHKAHKCRSCGGGDFISFHRYALDTQMSHEDSLLGQGSKTKGTAQVLSEETGKRLQTSLAQVGSPSLLSHHRVEQEFLDRVDKLIKYHKRGKEEATNLAPCECGERVELVVSALARHCLMVKDRTRAFYYLLESAAASLYLSNNYMVCFNMGQIALAKRLIKRALCLLHKGFPRTWLGAFFQSLLEESKHSAYHAQQRQAQHTDRKALAVLQQQIHCLSLLWQFYSLDSTANRKYSRLAALMEINLADESENKMQIISTYMDFSQFSQSMGYKDEWLKYEMMAIQRSSQCNFTFTRERLLMTAQLAQALAYSKLCLGHLTRSIQLGFDYRPIEECLQFINQYEASCILKSQSNIMLSLYSSLAIWFGRLQQWDLFEDSFTKAQRLVSRTNASLFGTHGFFRFLECQGLLLRKVMEDTPEKVREARSSTLRYFEEFLSRCSTSPVYHTRVYSLKASVNLLGDEDKSQVPLSKGLKLSATSQTGLEETSFSVSPDSVHNEVSRDSSL